MFSVYLEANSFCNIRSYVYYSHKSRGMVFHTVTQLWRNTLLFLDLLILFYVYKGFPCMHGFALHACLVPPEIRRHWVSWNQRHRPL